MIFCEVYYGRASLTTTAYSQWHDDYHFENDHNLSAIRTFFSSESEAFGDTPKISYNFVSTGIMENKD